MRSGAWRRLVVAAVIGSGAAACGERDDSPPVLPEPDSVAAWFGEETTEARLNGNVLEIRGRMDPEFLRRGGSLWTRSGPYFYLFNVGVQDILSRYPDLAAVRAITYDADGREVARATLHSRELNEYEWRTALALASLAQRQGTESLRHISELIRFGEDHTDYRYGGE